MTVVGTSSLEVERDGYKRERLKSLMLAEKRRAAVVAGQSATAVAAVTDAEAPALLKEVYRRADIPKPRNLIGMAKDIPPAEMETLLLATGVVRLTDGRNMSQTYCEMPHDGEFALRRYMKRVSIEYADI